MRFRVGMVRWLDATVCLLAAGCGGGGVTGAEPLPTRVVAVSGNDQVALAGDLSQPFVVLVRGEDGIGVPGVKVVWQLTSGQGALCTPSPLRCDSQTQTLRTDDGGRSQVQIRLLDQGPEAVTATVAGLAGSPVIFTANAIGVLINASPLFDCTGPDDPVRFADPAGSDDVTVAVGVPVVWEYSESLSPGCRARIVSTLVPDGGDAFDSGDLAPGQRFEFVPATAGTWEFGDQVSGGRGRLTAR